MFGIETEFDKLYEELSNINDSGSDDILTEKWETFDYYRQPVKIWHSTSASEFRAFLQNVPSTGIKGLRLAIKDGVYLAARASELSHDSLTDIAVENYLIDSRKDVEWSTCGFPKVEDFDTDNFEGNNDDNFDGEELGDDYTDLEDDVKARYAALAGEKYIVTDPDTAEVFEFVRDGKQHELIADCGTFEVRLYNFYSREYIAYQNGDGIGKTNFKLFETSETGYALKPLIKKLYITTY
jgi:hypothetical protein